MTENNNISLSTVEDVIAYLAEFPRDNEHFSEDDLSDEEFAIIDYLVLDLMTKSTAKTATTVAADEE